MWSWGYNGPSGQLGHGQSGSSHKCSSPEQISGTGWPTTMGQDARTLSATSNSNLVIKNNNTLWAWGGNSSGQLGLSNRSSYNSPQQVGSGTDWMSLIQAGSHNVRAAIKEDGTLWSWGYNGQGNLGHNNRTNISSPKQVPGTTWRSVAASTATWATKTDGTLWAMGYNNVGQLGQNEAGNAFGRSSPSQIPGTDWDFAYCWGSTLGATKKDGSMWSAGNSWNGSLGLSEVQVRRSSPVQMPGSYKGMVFATSAYGALKSVT